MLTQNKNCKAASILCIAEPSPGSPQRNLRQSPPSPKSSPEQRESTPPPRAQPTQPKEGEEASQHDELPIESEARHAGEVDAMNRTGTHVTDEQTKTRKKPSPSSEKYWYSGRRAKWHGPHRAQRRIYSFVCLFVRLSSGLAMSMAGKMATAGERMSGGTGL